MREPRPGLLALADPDEARQHADLTAAIAEFRERRRRLTITISRLVESKRTLENRLRTRARRAEPSAGASPNLSTEPKE